MNVIVLIVFVNKIFYEKFVIYFIEIFINKWIYNVVYYG